MIDEDELPSIPAEKKKENFRSYQLQCKAISYRGIKIFANWLRNNLSTYVPIEMQPKFLK